METVIAVSIVALAAIWAASRIIRRAKDRSADNPCGSGCAGCNCAGQQPPSGGECRPTSPNASR